MDHSLAFEPLSTVTVALTPSSEIGVSPATLVFNSTNHYLSRPIAIVGLAESDAVDDLGIVMVSTPPSGPTKFVSVTVMDND